MDNMIDNIDEYNVLPIAQNPQIQVEIVGVKNLKDRDNNFVDHIQLRVNQSCNKTQLMK